MKIFLITFIVSILSFAAIAQQNETPKEPAKNKKVLIVDAACGQCKLELKGSGCDLAIRLDGQAYFVDGTKIDEHGDAHAKDGFCNSIRKAKVQGEVIDNRFKATYFQLIPTSPTKKKED